MAQPSADDLLASMRAQRATTRSVAKGKCAFAAARDGCPPNVRDALVLAEDDPMIGAPQMRALLVAYSENGVSLSCIRNHRRHACACHGVPT